MKQNTVAAAVSFVLFGILVISSTGGEQQQNTNENSSASLIVENVITDEIPQTLNINEVVMKKPEWWNDAEVEANRMTEEEMAEMLESLWGPKEEDEESEEDNSAENSEKNSETEREKRKEKEEESTPAKNLTASILHLEPSSNDPQKDENKAESIIQNAKKAGGNENTKESNNSVNRISEDFSEKKTATEKSVEIPKPAVPEPDISQSLHYKDGIYSALGKYPKGDIQEEIRITFTIKNDIVQDFEITTKEPNESEKSVQKLFYENVHPYIVGEQLGSIPQFSSFGAGSDVSLGFSRAVESLRAQAKKEE